MPLIEPQDVYEAAWKLLYSECVEEETKMAMRETLARAFEKEYQGELQEEAEREATRRSSR